MSSAKPDPAAEALPSAALAELSELMWALPSSLDPNEIIAVLLERCTRHFDAPLAALWVREGTGFVLTGCFGFTEKKAEQLWQRLDLAKRGDRPLQLDGPELHALGGFGKRRLGAVLAVPLTSPRGTHGWMIFARLDPQPFSDLERSFIAILATRVAGSLENARQYQETQARSAELELLNEVSQLLVSSTRIEELLDRLVSRMVQTLGLTMCFVFLIGREGPTLRPRAIAHKDPEQRAGLQAFLRMRPLTTAEGRSAEIFRSGKPVLIPNLLEESVIPADIRERLGAGSVLVLPLVSREEFLGAMYMVRSNRGAPLSPEILPLATHLANQVSVGIANARLYEELEGKVKERTTNLQQVYEQLAERMIAGRDHFAKVGEDLKKEMAALDRSLAELGQELSQEPADTGAARASLNEALEVVARLDAVHGRFFERMKEGANLGMPPLSIGG